jgi:hypothetical protein
MSRLLYKTCTFTPIGRTSLLHNGWRPITDRKVRVSQYFYSKLRVSTSRISVVEVRNIHGERPDKQSSITELINTLRDAPRFAQPGGMAHIPYICDLNQVFFSSERERLYGKDMHCPAEWRNWVKTSGVLPDVVIPGATGDVLPESVETLMGYLGVSDTCMHSLHSLSIGH